jgi:hypothetical protein
MHGHCGLGPKPGAPQNLTLTDHMETFSVIVSWGPPIDIDRVPVAYYQIQSKTADVPQWKMLNKERIIPPTTSYSVKSKLIKYREWTKENIHIE